MLLNLHVKNIALIKEADISFAEGLNIITGETGTGKSLLLGSLNMALGGKFTREMLRTGEDNALVELVFLVDNSDAEKMLEEAGYPADDGELILTRRMFEGRVASRINGETCPSSALKKIAEILINIHGQRENQVLLKSDRQLGMLDTYGGEDLLENLQETKDAYFAFRSAESALKNYTMDEEKRLRELSILEYEINEIEEAGIFKGEEEELEKQYARMVNSKKIMEVLNSVHENTGYDSGAGDLIGQAVKQIDAIYDLDDEISQIADALADAESIVSDINRQTASYLNDFVFSEHEFESTRDRLDKIHFIQSKYGSTLEKINNYLAENKKRLEFLQNYENDKAEAQNKKLLAEELLKRSCDTLSEKRKRYAIKLSEALQKQLLELNFPQADIKIEFSRASSYRENGFDDIDTLISTNPGEPMMSLAKVASGGELSRIMLAIKNIIADKENTETLIFDEIDAGISGRTAQKVSEKLASISAGHQVLLVTHLAQIAAMADRHFVIEKSLKGNETITSIRKLAPEEEISELARILGGAKITEATRANASEMKELANEYKKNIQSDMKDR